MEENNQMTNNTYTYNEPTEPTSQQDKGSFGYAVLGFFIPLVGLLLFLIWRKTRPGDAKKAGIGALVNVILQVVLVIFAIIYYSVMWPSVQQSIVDQTCLEYGSNYKAVKTGNTWYCENTVTGQRIELE